MPILLAFVHQTPQFSFTTVNTCRCRCGIRQDVTSVKYHDVVDIDLELASEGTYRARLNSMFKAHQSTEEHLRCPNCGEMAILKVRVFERLPYRMVTGPKMTATASLKKVMKPVTTKARRHDGKDLMAVYHLGVIIVRKDRFQSQTFFKEGPMDEEVSLWTKYEGRSQPNLQHSLDETVMFGKEYEFVSAIYT
ncbi:hypothetical protein C1H76_4936 [Elsinoe australis]|uniref:Uncharacterized protein n=1 Tax=Elsinoe australis TaxID=40998 RepID=A0A4U7B0Q3_9PEZI|nr:hypothetical protein C1H76_4936 [Elsinoe australis]